MTAAYQRYTALRGLVIDRELREARVGDDRLYLGAREFDLLATLAEDPVRLISYDALWQEAFEYGVGITPRVIARYAERVRRKLELRGLPDLLRDESGLGLRLLGPSTGEQAEREADALAEVA
jgi:DNA-binding response OmpR family regulator